MSTKTRKSGKIRTGIPGQKTDYEFEIYNADLDDIFDKYCRFSDSEIDDNPTYCIRMMALGARRLENFLTLDDVRSPTSSIKWGTLEEVLSATDEDFEGFPRETFRHRDRLLRKVKSRLADLSEIYKVDTSLGESVPKPKGAGRGRWSDRDDAKDAVQSFARGIIQQRPEIRTGEIVDIIMMGEYVIKPDQTS